MSDSENRESVYPLVIIFLGRMIGASVPGGDPSPHVPFTMPETGQIQSSSSSFRSNRYQIVDFMLWNTTFCKL